jgi:hypothetical protein
VAKSYQVRDAIKLAIHWCRVAQDTGNRELRANAREFIRSHWRMRNEDKVIVLNR